MKLSVLMIAYNVESYIEEAIESVLAQRTTFDFELVIGEDCSKDNTRAVIRSYEARYPGKIRCLFREQNLGMVENFLRTYRACDGEYIAVLDGDDYWIDPLKLQKQADLLDAHPEWALCFHDTYSRTGGPDLDSMPRMTRPDHPAVSNFIELLAENFIASCSVMWRNLGSDVVFPEGMEKLKFYDWPIHLMNAQRGLIGYLPEVMAVYRVSASGLWSQLDAQIRYSAIIDTYKVLDRYFEYRYALMIDKLIRFNDLLSPLSTYENRELKLYREAVEHLKASRSVRFGLFLGRIARALGRLGRRLTPRLPSLGRSPKSLR